MERDEAISLLRGGEEGVRRWNERRGSGDSVPALNDVDFSGVSLRQADLRDTMLSGVRLANADLHRADLRGAILLSGLCQRANLSHSILRGAFLNFSDCQKTNLTSANLEAVQCVNASFSGACLAGTRLDRAQVNASSFCNANFVGAALGGADLRGVDFSGADFSDAAMGMATVVGSNLSGAKLARADLSFATLLKTDMTGASLAETVLRLTTFAAGTTLGLAVDLEKARFDAPCFVSPDVAFPRNGAVPESFLRGCGMQPWEIIAGKLYDPALTASQINDLQYSIFAARTRPIFIGGVFISYSHEDAAFAEKMRDRLMTEGASVWLDRHDAVSGPLQAQVDHAIRLHDVVLLVLSKASVDSDWVEHELKMGRRKEKEEGRDVLLPVALDSAWKRKMHDILWEQVGKKHVLDFCGWEGGENFELQFRKLLRGLRIYYPAREDSSNGEAACTR